MCTSCRNTAMLFSPVLALGGLLSRPPQAFSRRDNKSGVRTIIPTPLEAAHTSIDFPIDYCQENRYNGFGAQ